MKLTFKFATMKENVILFRKRYIKLVHWWIFSAQCNCVCTIFSTGAKSTNKIEKKDIFKVLKQHLLHVDENVLDFTSDCSAIIPFIKQGKNFLMFRLLNCSLYWLKGIYHIFYKTGLTWQIIQILLLTSTGKIRRWNEVAETFV